VERSFRVRTEGSVVPDTAPIDTDVLVVGLGPVGAALANLLGGFVMKLLGMY
jgi:lactate dehydrogenase-like 2-hydroxyacid dehydrogenase